MRQEESPRRRSFSMIHTYAAERTVEMALINRQSAKRRAENRLARKMPKMTMVRVIDFRAARVAIIN